MSLETCIACGADVHAWHKGFSLCEEHYREAQAIDWKKADAERASRRQRQLVAFRAEYPEIEVSDGR